MFFFLINVLLKLNKQKHNFIANLYAMNDKYCIKKMEASTVKLYMKTRAENERINLKKILVTSRKSMGKENLLPA